MGGRKSSPGQGRFGIPREGTGFQMVAGISLLEKVRFELRLEGGQGVRLPLSRGRLFPAEGIAKARAPNALEKQQGGPRDWARGREEPQEGAGSQDAVGFVGCLGALASTLRELEKHDRV